jgi:hypothetical protein
MQGFRHVNLAFQKSDYPLSVKWPANIIPQAFDIAQTWLDTTTAR